MFGRNDGWIARHPAFFVLLEWIESDIASSANDGRMLTCSSQSTHKVRWHNVARYIPPILVGPLSSVSFARFPVYLPDKKMEEPLKRRRSASLWNWFDKLRLDQQRRRVIGDKVKPDHPNRRVNADLNLNLSYLTLDESPVKRRWIPKRMTRPVSCYVLTGGDDGQQKKNRSFFETHFPSDPIPQRVRAAGSIQTLVSLNKPDDRQQVRTSA